VKKRIPGLIALAAFVAFCLYLRFPPLSRYALRSGRVLLPLAAGLIALVATALGNAALPVASVSGLILGFFVARNVPTLIESASGRTSLFYGVWTAVFLACLLVGVAITLRGAFRKDGEP